MEGRREEEREKDRQKDTRKFDHLSNVMKAKQTIIPGSAPELCLIISCLFISFSFPKSETTSIMCNFNQRGSDSGSIMRDFIYLERWEGKWE